MWVKRIISDETMGCGNQYTLDNLNKFGGKQVFEGNFHDHEAKLW